MMRIVITQEGDRLRVALVGNTGLVITSYTVAAADEAPTIGGYHSGMTYGEAFAAGVLFAHASGEETGNLYARPLVAG